MKFSYMFSATKFWISRYVITRAIMLWWFSKFYIIKVFLKRENYRGVTVCNTIIGKWLFILGCTLTKLNGVKQPFILATHYFMAIFISIHFLYYLQDLHGIFICIHAYMTCSHGGVKLFLCCTWWDKGPSYFQTAMEQWYVQRIACLAAHIPLYERPHCM